VNGFPAGAVIPAPAATTRARAAARHPAAPAMAEPRWGLFHHLLAALLLTYVWRLHQIVPGLGPLQVVSVASLAALGLFLVSGTVARTGVVARTPVFRLAALVLAWMILSVPFALFPGYSARFLYEDHGKTFLLMLLVAAGVQGLRQVERMVAVHVAGAVVYTLYVLSHFRMSGGRLQGLVYYDSNDLGMLLVCTLPLAAYFLRPGSPATARLLAGGAALVCVLGIVRTGSRGALVGLAAVGIYLLLRFTAFPPRTRLRVAAGGLAALLAVGNAQYWEMMRTLLHPSQDYNWAGQSQEGRMEVWKRGLGYMAARPVLGVGVSGFFVAEGTLSPRARARQFTGGALKWSAPHNSFVQAGAELGVPGLAAFVWLLAAAYRAARSREGSRPPGAPAPPATVLGQALAASLVGYVVTAFFLSQAYAAFLYTLLGLVIAFAISVPVPGAEAAQAAAPHSPRPRPRGRGGGWHLPPAPPAAV
jgi:O-antigen ligase